MRGGTCCGILWFLVCYNLLLVFLTVPIHILNMVYRPGLTGLTGWLKSRQLTDLYTHSFVPLLHTFLNGFNNKLHYKKPRLFLPPKQILILVYHGD